MSWRPEKSGLPTPTRLAPYGAHCELVSRKGGMP